MNVAAEQAAFEAWITAALPGVAVRWDATAWPDGMAGDPAPRSAWMRGYWVGWLARAAVAT